MEGPITQSDWPCVTLTSESPDYLDIEWEGICKLYIYLWCIAMIVLMSIGCLWQVGVSAVPAAFLVWLFTCTAGWECDCFDRLNCHVSSHSGGWVLTKLCQTLAEAYQELAYFVEESHVGDPIHRLIYGQFESLYMYTSRVSGFLTWESTRVIVTSFAGEITVTGLFCGLPSLWSMYCKKFQPEEALTVSQYTTEVEVICSVYLRYYTTIVKFGVSIIVLMLCCSVLLCCSVV